MKRILITGANSYIGTKFEKWLAQWPEQYQVETVDTLSDQWRLISFGSADAVLHVAGIVHQKESSKNAEQYFKINRDLAFNIAVKAKNDGVKQFILLSSMSVFGVETGVITSQTIPNPVSFYGKSKLQAEKQVAALQDDTFKVAIIRPPMVYGPGCRGNYNTLANFARKSPFFPNYANQRSMIFIDNLCWHLQSQIDNSAEGIFHPQNSQYVCTSELVRLIAENHGHPIHMTRVLNPFIRLVRLNIVNKIFGSLTYDWSLSADAAINQVDFITSVKMTES